MAYAPADIEEERLRLELRLKLLETHERATGNFIDFCQYVWPEMLVGDHHRMIAEKFDRVISGECKRLIVAMPPRHGKSQMGSYLFPAYLMGKLPQSKLIVGSHTAELAQRFGRMIRNLVDDERYKELFPNMQLSADSKAAGRWNTKGGGEVDRNSHAATIRGGKNFRPIQMHSPLTRTASRPHRQHATFNEPGHASSNTN